MSDFIEIGNNIVLLRSRQGLSREEVAFRANQCAYTLFAVEHGRVNATVDTLIRFSIALGIDSRVLGFFSRTDEDILSEIRQAPWLPQKNGNALQVCENIVLFRKEQGITQKQLAHLAGISAAWLRDIEHGCANMSMDMLLRISKAFDLTLMKLACLAMSEEELMKLVREARDKAGI